MTTGMERGQIADMSEKSADCVRDGGEMSELEHDTREKLEEDVRKHYAYSTTTLMYPPSANKSTDMLSALPVDTVIGWLDRQAAITKKACVDFWQEIAEDRDRAQAKCAELCNQVDALKAKLDAEAQHAREAWRLWGEADVKLERMTAERDRWKDAFEDSERLRLELVKDLEHARKWNDTWRDLVRRYEGLCDGLLDERDAMRGDA